MTKKQKKMLTRILITLVVFGVLFTCEKLGYLECFPWYINFVIFLIPYLLIGYDILRPPEISAMDRYLMKISL